LGLSALWAVTIQSSTKLDIYVLMLYTKNL
jgi:hypothetical protein